MKGIIKEKRTNFCPRFTHGMSNFFLKSTCVSMNSYHPIPCVSLCMLVDMLDSICSNSYHPIPCVSLCMLVDMLDSICSNLLLLSTFNDSQIFSVSHNRLMLTHVYVIVHNICLICLYGALGPQQFTSITLTTAFFIFEEKKACLCAHHPVLFS